METGTVPYLWMGSGWSAWLEWSNDNSHAALVALAERLCRDFGGVVTERYPEGPAEEGKEYWWVNVSGAKLMLMRKPPHMGVGLSAGPHDVELLVRIARTWGVVRFVGWRWRAWRVWSWLTRGKHAQPLAAANRRGE